MAVPSLKQIADQVKLIVDDSTYDTYITEYVNDVIAELTEEILFPNLKAESTVTATSATDNVSLPTDYHRGLYNIYNQTSEYQNILITRHDDFFARYYPLPDETGDIQVVCIKGNKLYYQPIPSESQTLRLYYYKVQAALSGDSDSVSMLDVGSASNGKWCIIHGVCKKIFDQIEDGIAGAKVNTNNHDQRYEFYKRKLRATARPEFFRPPVIPHLV